MLNYNPSVSEQKIKARTPKQLREYALKSYLKKPPKVAPKRSPKKSYMMPASDSSDQNDLNEPYPQNYHRQQATMQDLDNEGQNDDTEYIEYVSYSDDYNQEEASSSTGMNDNSNSLLNVATPNPISELKIVNVTSLPAEKHNEIMNNDDNAMNAMDSHYNHDTNHQLKINEIISKSSNSNVFGIAKKAASESNNSLLTVASSKPYQSSQLQTYKSYSRKPNSKIQKMKQQMQNNYRLSGAAVQNIEEASCSTSSPARKEFTDSDDHSNSKFNYKMSSRRKNALTPLDCEMEFVEVNPPKLKKQAHMTNEQRLLSSQLETVRSIKNPNADLLRKVAFLRVCVNFMMTELEGETFNFGKNITFDNLRTKYNSKRLA